MVAKAKNVQVLGDNVISALGFSTQENFERLLNNESGLQLQTNDTLYPTSFIAAAIDNAWLATYVQGENLSKYSRLEQLLILSIKDATKHLSIDFSDSGVQLILATTKGNIESIRSVSNPPAEAYLWQLANNVANYFGITTKPEVISNACISGVLAIEYGAQHVREGKCKLAITVGGDILSSFVLAGFASFKSLSPNPCKPYDESRDGLSLGEACAAVVLASDDFAVSIDQSKLPKPIYVLGGGCSNDANHISGPSRTGDGLALAMSEALAQSKLQPSDISWIVAHGTATPFNDEMESKAVNLLNMQHIPLSGMKGYIGHTLGASGIVESVFAIVAMRNNRLIATKGFDKHGVPMPLNVVAEHSQQPVPYCLKTASGFGGCNAALVFSTEKKEVKIAERSVEVKLLKKVSINQNAVFIDEQKTIEKGPSLAFPEFIRELYKELELSYSKFYKMDELCKLGFIAAEYLLKDIDLSAYQPEELGIVLYNSTSSLDTDMKFQSGLEQNGAAEASPAIFVYTLANIVAGELAIRHKMQGRNIFFIQEHLNPMQMQEYVSRQMQQSGIKLCIAGWIDFLNGSYTVDLGLFRIDQTIPA